VGGGDVPTPVYPLSGAEIPAEGLQLTWKPSTKALSYQVQVARDSLFEQIEIQAADLQETSLPLPALSTGRRYYWRVRWETWEGWQAWSAGHWFVTQDGLLPPATDGHYAIHALYPNPASNRVTMRYEIPGPARVVLSVFDVLGRRVLEIADDRPLGGIYDRGLELSHLAGGLYLVRMQVPSEVFSTTFILNK
jgi:hypothetical protein